MPASANFRCRPQFLEDDGDASTGGGGGGGGAGARSSTEGFRCGGCGAS